MSTFKILKVDALSKKMVGLEKCHLKPRVQFTSRIKCFVLMTANTTGQNVNRLFERIMCWIKRNIRLANCNLRVQKRNRNTRKDDKKRIFFQMSCGVVWCRDYRTVPTSLNVCSLSCKFHRQGNLRCQLGRSFSTALIISWQKMGKKTRPP